MVNGQSEQKLAISVFPMRSDMEFKSSFGVFVKMVVGESGVDDWIELGSNSVGIESVLFQGQVFGKNLSSKPKNLTFKFLKLE